MKKYITLYKPFLFFLAKFFLTYLILTLVYQGYLKGFENDQIDGITKFVAKSTKGFLDIFNIDFYVKNDESGFNVQLFYKQKYIARMIEGCNAVSVMILFVAFIVSFSGKLKTTLLYILGGLILIHLLNIIRIAALCILLYSFPEYEIMLHRVFFSIVYIWICVCIVGDLG